MYKACLLVWLNVYGIKRSCFTILDIINGLLAYPKSNHDLLERIKIVPIEESGFRRLKIKNKEKK